MENVSPAQPGDQREDPALTSTATAPSGSVAGEQPVIAPSAPAATTEQQQPQKKEGGADDEEDSDFDELDDVLDDFSKPKAQANMQTATPPPSAATTTAASNAEPATGIADADFDEDAFLKQLEKDMASMMSQGGPQADAPDPESFQAAVDQGADAFAKQLEESGVPPGDFLKQLLADVMAEGGGGSGDASSGAAAAAAASAASSAAPPQSQTSTSTEAVEQQKEEQPAESFNDAIQRTINRMKESGDKATAAASSNENDEISDDLLAQLLKAVEAGAAGAGDDGDLTKMFMGMMEQLSNKEMLYEPMKELDGKFEPWIERNKASGKITAEDMERYQTQARVVRQIVSKFEEEGYSDEDPKCREFVWERMQEMQAAGSPPEELISNPLMEDFGAGAGGVPDCPQQ